MLCGCDQVGTLKILTDKTGGLVKEIVRDSFGVQLWDSFPDLFIPIGFAGGLTDPDTGLVRFGYRYYDPGVGRFTAPDPFGDTGGNHDLYDYCIDDPLTMNDPSGLFPPALYALAAFGVRFLPRLPALLTAASQRIGAAIHASKHGDKIIKAANFAEGFLNPNAPSAPTGAGAFGAGAAYIKKEIEKRQE